MYQRNIFNIFSFWENLKLNFSFKRTNLKFNLSLIFKNYINFNEIVIFFEIYF